MAENMQGQEEFGLRPEVLVISDSSGQTAADVVRAATSQFKGDVIRIKRLSQVRSVDQVREYLDSLPSELVPGAVFHTIVDHNMRSEIRAELDRRTIPSIDLLGPAINVISTLTGEEPVSVAGRRSQDDERFHSRVTGMNFFADHDEGANPQELKDADAVLFGVTRTSKTPLSLYLAFLGYKVANITYTMGSEPPEQLFQIDPRRVFGMVRTSSAAEAHAEAPNAASGTLPLMGESGAQGGPDEEDLAARAVMDRIGCTIIPVGGRPIEELANDILEHLRKIEG